MDKTLFSFKVEATKRKIKGKIDEGVEVVKEAGNWAIEHPMEALAIGSAAATGVYNLARVITKNRAIKHEQYIADCRFYDPRYGEYVFSKRKLTTGERNRLKDIYNSDRKMSYSQALTKMGLNKD